jgi:hypothetical protein
VNLRGNNIGTSSESLLDRAQPTPVSTFPKFFVAKGMDQSSLPDYREFFERKIRRRRRRRKRENMHKNSRRLEKSSESKQKRSIKPHWMAEHFLKAL